MKEVLNDLLKKIADKVLVNERVSSEEANSRFKICKTCENFDSANEKCKLCGCYMEIKTASKVHFNFKKQRTEITHCPVGYWGDIDTANYYKDLD